MKEVLNILRILIMLITQHMIVGWMMMMIQLVRRERGKKERSTLDTLDIL